MSDFKNLKFRVNSPEQSAQVQNALFKLGYVNFIDKSTSPRDTNCEMVYCYEDGDVTTGRDDPNMVHAELDTQAFINKHNPPSTTPAEKLVWWNDKYYIESEFNAAIANIRSFTL